MSTLQTQNKVVTGSHVGLLGGGSSVLANSTSRALVSDIRFACDDYCAKYFTVSSAIFNRALTYMASVVLKVLGWVWFVWDFEYDFEC